MTQIDTHQHFWKYHAEQYPWMSGEMSALRRDFLPPDLEPRLRAAGIDGTVAVQARQTVEESAWLLDLARQYPFIRGVVGWAPLVHPSVAGTLECLSANPLLKGVRHVLHDESDDFYMLREDFNRGIAALRQFGLSYDILIFERHLPQTLEFVDRHPNQVFVVDHIAKPRIRDGVLAPWRELLGRLAERENVYCKVSGMVTEAAWHSWKAADLEPYFEVVLNAFGPDRLMFGSDWPVLLLAGEYEGWTAIVRSAVARLSQPEQQRILGGTACEVYRL